MSIEAKRRTTTGISAADRAATVLAAIERERVDHILSVGDVVGYGAAPSECITKLRKGGGIECPSDRRRTAAAARCIG